MLSLLEISLASGVLASLLNIPLNCDAQTFWIAFWIRLHSWTCTRSLCLCYETRTVVAPRRSVLHRTGVALQWPFWNAEEYECNNSDLNWANLLWVLGFEFFPMTKNLQVHSVVVLLFAYTPTIRSTIFSFIFSTPFSFSKTHSYSVAFQGCYLSKSQCASTVVVLLTHMPFPTSLPQGTVVVLLTRMLFPTSLPQVLSHTQIVAILVLTHMLSPSSLPPKGKASHWKQWPPLLAALCHL